MLKRRYRVVIECEVTVSDLTPQGVKARHAEFHQRWVERFGGKGLYEPPERELPPEQVLEDQRLLQEALLASPELLEDWIIDGIATCFSDLELEGFDGELDSSTALLPAVEKLPPRQRHLFREAIAQGRLVEIAGEFYDSFESKQRFVRLERVE